MKADYSKLPAAWSCILIDGDNGAGKTTLGKQMAKDLGAKLISFDDYLPGDCTAYLQQLNFEALRRDIVSGKSKVIVEGVCGLKVLARISVRPDYHIFIKRLSGIIGWENGAYLGKYAKPPRSEFTREIVGYYKEFAPFDKCNEELLFDIAGL